MTASAVVPVRSSALVPRSSSAPNPLLRHALGRVYAGFAEAQGPHVGLRASASVGLIVKIEDTPDRPPAFVMGVHGEHCVLDGACAAEYLQVFLRPLGAYTLLGIPMIELRGKAVDLAEVFGREGRRVVEQLRAEATWTGRFAVLDRLLLRRLSTGPAPAPEVARAWQLLQASGGSMPIGRIATEVGWSHKHLITRVGQQIGLAPKTAARLIRFDRVLQAMDRPEQHGWARTAAEAGYADQSHLIRDFRTFTGGTPGQFLARSRRGTAESRCPDPGRVQSAPDAATAASVGSSRSLPTVIL